MMYLVTVKLRKGHAGPHNPARKVTGKCPADPTQTCTDVTGEHHTVVFLSTGDVEHVRTRFEGQHITRIEGVQP